MPSSPGPVRPPAPLIRVAAILIVVAAGVTDYFTPADFYPPVLCAIAIAVCAGLVDGARDRRFVWTLTVVALLLNFAGGHLSLPLFPPVNPAEFWVNRALVGIVIVSLAAIVDWRIRAAVRLAAAYEELDRRRQQAEDASARKSRFMAAVSHDVRTPAQAISLLAEVIRLNAHDPDRLADLTQRLKSSAVALSELLADVLDTTRFDLGGMNLRESEFCLTDVVGDACRGLRTSAERKGLTLRWNAAEPASRVRSDRVMLLRVLTNLIENGIKYTDAGEVGVEVDPMPDGSLETRVTDTGIGIDAEHLPHVFDEFFQVRNRQHRGSGWGLGLATCRRLVEAMNGRLTVQSTVGRGTTFRLTLPASRVLMHPSQPKSDPASSHESAGATATHGERSCGGTR